MSASLRRIFPAMAVASLVTALMAVTMGGVVRVTGSGLGCPDWPLCYGQVIPPWELTSWLEYLHRLSAAVAGVVLQHAPDRRHFTDLGEAECEIPPLSEEIELVRLLGAEVWAVTLNAEGLDARAAEAVRLRTARELGLPVALPLTGGLEEVAATVEKRLAEGARNAKGAQR